MNKLRLAAKYAEVAKKDYAHFLAIARGSLYETLTQLEIAQDLGYASFTTEIEQLATEIGRILGSMIKKYGTIRKA